MHSYNYLLSCILHDIVPPCHCQSIIFNKKELGKKERAGLRVPHCFLMHPSSLHAPLMDLAGTAKMVKCLAGTCSVAPGPKLN